MPRSFIVPMTCPHCDVDDLNGPWPVVQEGGLVRLATRVVWQGLASTPQGMAPVTQWDAPAGQVPSRVEHPMVTNWIPTAAYCPNCRTSFHCGPDPVQEAANDSSPGIVLPT
jgi:hypothetical protein